MLACLILCVLSQDATHRMVAAIRKLDTVEVRFRQETYSDFMDDTVAEGVLSIARPGKMRMTYTRGEQKTFICDGVTYYEHDRLADTETRVAFDELDSEPLVRLLLFGDDPEKHFRIDSDTVDGVVVFRLRPLEKGDYHLEVVFDENWFPSRLEVFGEDGEGTRFTFSDWRLHPTLAPETFEVPAPEPR